MQKFDALGDARELRGHVGACEVFHMERAVTEYASSQAASKVRTCGTGDPIWYGPDVKA